MLAGCEFQQGNEVKKKKKRINSSKKNQICNKNSNNFFQIELRIVESVTSNLIELVCFILLQILILRIIKR